MGLVWAPVVLIVLWFLRDAVIPRPSARGGQGGVDSGLSALDQARRAYARGDLSRERYLQVVEDLGETKGG